MALQRAVSSGEQERQEANNRILELKGRSHLLKTAALRLRSKEAEQERALASLQASKADCEAKVSPAFSPISTWPYTSSPQSQPGLVLLLSTQRLSECRQDRTRGKAG